MLSDLFFSLDEPSRSVDVGKPLFGLSAYTHIVCLEQTPFIIKVILGWILDQDLIVDSAFANKVCSVSNTNTG